MDNYQNRKPYTDKRSKDPLDFCNTCGCMFVDSGHKDGERTRQSLKNRRYLATFGKNNEVVQECCQECMTDIVSMCCEL